MAKKRYKTTSEYADLFTTPKQRKRRNIQDSGWNAAVSKETAHECPGCGNNKAVDIIKLRRGFYECRKCGKTFIDTPLGDEEEDNGYHEV